MSVNGKKLKDAEQSFEEIYRRYLPKVQSFALSYLNDQDLAKNVAQDVFISFWGARDRINNKENVLPYILSSTRNKCLNILKKRTNEGKYKGYILKEKTDYLNYLSLADEYSIRIYQSEIELLLGKAMNNMSSKVRSTFFMSRIKDMTNKEIAIQQNISVRGVEERIKSSMLVIRKIFKDYQ